MKKSLLILTTLALPLWPAMQASAAVNPAVVPADARWIAHVDLNALRAGAIGKELLALVEKAQFNTQMGNVGIDGQKVLATIGTATAYGTNISSDPKQIDGTLVIEGTADLRKIAESLLLQANIADPKQVVELTDLGFPAYAIRSKTKPLNQSKDGADSATTKPVETMEVVIAFPPEPMVLVSKSRAQILKAREVIKGGVPSVAKTAGAPLAKFMSGSKEAYIFAASTVPAEQFLPKEDAPQARILKMTEAGSLALGERGENVFAHSDLLANSGQMAEKLMKILQGMAAMLSLAETNDKALSAFINSVGVNREGNTVTLDLSYPSSNLAAMVKSLAQKEESPAARGAALMIHGRSVAEWQAEAGPAPKAGEPATPEFTARTIPNVTLKTGSMITLARQSNGGRGVRFDHIEIVPEGGAGSPLTFRPEFMRNAGPRGNWQQFPFPGTDGVYTLKVFYGNDAAGKATYAVSVNDPKAPAPVSDGEAKSKK